MRILSVCMLTAGCFFFSSAQAQFNPLKKLKQKAEQVLDKKTDETVDKSVGIDNNQSTDNGGSQGPGNSSSRSTSSSRSNPNNKGGAGLVTTPPDVKENVGVAEAVFKEGKYSEARYAVQQAMLGVEMQIGQQILKTLPESIGALKFDPKADQVTSTGWGWVGLTIKREYNNGEQQLRFSVNNNAAWMQAINLYFNNTGYAQTTGGEQGWKQTRIKGLRAVIEYNDGDGYKLSAPLGQTSLLVFEGVNFANEQEFVKACEGINIDSIKAKLGEK